MSGRRSVIHRSGDRCPDCLALRVDPEALRVVDGEPCTNRFHDRLPTHKGWTP